jgi:hypothetical protein
MTTNNPCAWCLHERDEKPNPEHSHGICERHFEEVRARVWERRAKGGAA